MLMSAVAGLQALLATKDSCISLAKASLRFNDPNSPYCYVASNSTEVMNSPGANFLATQIWPSARIASDLLAKHFDPSWSLCEFGCGPGLPSITAALLGSPQVIATDKDKLALSLVEKASADQNLTTNLRTMEFDLIEDAENIPPAKVYLLSDIFQSDAVARGAAKITQAIWEETDSYIWVLAQSDRAQRETYREVVARALNLPDLNWQSAASEPARLWLVDVDELQVRYG